MTNLKPHIVRKQEENLIKDLKQAIAQPASSSVMFYAWGIGGVGKSTLLNRVQENLDAHYSQKIHFAKISFGAISETSLGVMVKLHKELPALGIFQKDLWGKSDSFKETHQTYDNTLNELETKPIDGNGSPSKEQIDQVKQLSKLLLNTGIWAGQTALAAGTGNPFSLLAASTTTAAVNSTVDATIDGVSTALALKDELLLKHQTTKQNQELRDLMLEPLPKLTQAFVDTLVRHAKQIPVVLILDAYHKSSADVDMWLRQFFLTNKELQNSNVRLVVAGRDDLFKKEGWKELILNSKIVQRFSLKEFEAEQTKRYLAQIGIEDKRDKDRLCKTTKGFPFHLDLIRKEKEDGEPINYAEEISELLLKGLSEPQKRLVEIAACCRWFDKSLLEKLVNCQELDFTMGVDPNRNCFDWLKDFDIVEYVKDSDGKYCLKDVARDAIRKSLYNDNRNKFREIHSLLQKYFEEEANQEVSADNCESEKYENSDWSGYTSEAIYHAFFCLQKEDGKRYFLIHFLMSRYFDQIGVVIMPFLAIAAEAEIADNSRLPHENRKFLKSLENIDQHFVKVWAVMLFDPTYEIKMNDTQLSRIELERIENTIKIFLEQIDYLPNGWAKLVGLSSKLLRCRTTQKLELIEQAKIQAEFLKDKINIKHSSNLFCFVGNAFASLEKYEEAIASYDKAIKLNKDLLEAWCNRGVAMIELEKYEEGIANCDEAIKLKKDSTEAWCNRGAALSGLGRYEEGLANCDEAIKLKQDFPLAWSNRGAALIGLGRYEEGLANCDEAIKLKKDLHQTWDNRGLALLNLGRYEEAIASYDESLKLKKDFPNAWHNLRKIFHKAWSNRGLALLNSGRCEEAITSYDESLKLKDDLPETWSNRGLALLNSGKYEEAIVSYDKAIELKDDLPETWSNRGLALLNSGKYEEALVSYDKAIELKVDLPEAWANRGVALGNLERYEEAIASYDEAIKLKHDLSETWDNRGLALIILEKYEEAIASYNEAIKLKHDLPEAFLSRGIALTRLGKYDEAIDDFNRAVELEPDNIRYRVSRGVLFGWMGQHKEALEACDIVLQHSLNEVNALYAKSCCYSLQGNIEDSVKYLGLAINQKPNETRKRAKRDPEFNEIREDRRFQELVNVS